MISIQRIKELIVDATDDFILALEDHLRSHPKRTAPVNTAPTSLLTDGERADIARFAAEKPERLADALESEVDANKRMAKELEAADNRVIALEDELATAKTAAEEGAARIAALEADLEKARTPAPAPEPGDDNGFAGDTAKLGDTRNSPTNPADAAHDEIFNGTAWVAIASLPDGQLPPLEP